MLKVNEVEVKRNGNNIKWMFMVEVFNQLIGFSLYFGNCKEVIFYL